jgi:hypothetical protein
VWDKDSTTGSSGGYSLIEIFPLDECIGATTISVADIIGSKDQRAEVDLIGAKKRITGKLIIQIDK